MTGTAEDIWYTTANETLFRAIVEHCADAVVAINRAQQVVLFNRAAGKMFDRAPRDVIGQPLSILLPDRIRHEHTALVEGFAKERGTARYMADRRSDIVGRRADGTEFPAGISILHALDSETPVMVAIIRDRTEQRRMEQTLEELANTDPLTGALNRRAFMAGARSICETARRHRRGVSALLLDIDRFKGLNDTYGHAVGDLAIVQVFQRFSDSLRAGDLLGRWGGEEFVALLPDADARGARIVAERVRSVIEETPLAPPGCAESVYFTASLGVAALHDDDDGPDSLIQRADDALYRAKAAGRNQVCGDEKVEA